MHNRSIAILTSIFLIFTANFAQSISIDLDNEVGIQNTFTSRDTGATIAIAIRFTGVNQISSYQFKVSFDTSRFTFIGAQQDFGITGEKNILTKNSGSIIGIAQLQLNPPAKDTVEFSYSITGNNASSLVSGDGLAGVLYLKSKIPLGDSSSIMVSNGILADFELNQTTVNVYHKGTYSVLPVTWNIKQNHDNKYISETMSSVFLSIQNNFIRFEIPYSIVKSSKMVSFVLYTINGKFLTEYTTVSANNDFYTIHGNDNKLFNQNGYYLCCLKIGGRSYSQIVSFH